MSEQQESRSWLNGACFLAGSILQSLVLGILLAMALISIAAWSGGMRVFRYEGF